jgi:hypothetical protein
MPTLAALLALSLSAAPPPQPPRWLSDLDEARQQAKATGRPLFVVFRCEH